MDDSRNLFISFWFSDLMEYWFLKYSLIFFLFLSKYNYNFDRDYIEPINCRIQATNNIKSFMNIGYLSIYLGLLFFHQCFILFIVQTSSCLAEFAPIHYKFIFLYCNYLFSYLFIHFYSVLGNWAQGHAHAWKMF